MLDFFAQIVQEGNIFTWDFLEIRFISMKKTLYTQQPFGNSVQ